MRFEIEINDDLVSVVARILNLMQVLDDYWGNDLAHSQAETIIDSIRHTIENPHTMRLPEIWWRTVRPGHSSAVKIGSVKAYS